MWGLTIFRAYLEGGVLLALAYCVFSSGIMGALKGRWRLDSRRWLGVGRVLFAAALLIPVVASFLPKRALFHPAAQVWSGAPKAGAEPYAVLTDARIQRAPANEVADRGLVVTEKLLILLCLAFLAGALTSVLRLALQLFSLSRILRDLPVLRRIGRVRLLVS